MMPAKSPAGPISSVSFKLFALQALDRQGPDDLGRGFVDRLHAEKRRGALNDAAHRRGSGPASGRVTVTLLVGVRFVYHHQNQIFRVVDREDPDKAGKQFSF